MIINVIVFYLTPIFNVGLLFHSLIVFGKR